MSDIVEWLHAYAYRKTVVDLNRFREAADEIETLRAENEKLRALAHAVCFFDWSDNDEDAVLAIANLRAALGERT